MLKDNKISYIAKSFRFTCHLFKNNIVQSFTIQLRTQAPQCMHNCFTMPISYTPIVELRGRALYKRFWVHRSLSHSWVTSLSQWCKQDILSIVKLWTPIRLNKLWSIDWHHYVSNVKWSPPILFSSQRIYCQTLSKPVFPNLLSTHRSHLKSFII